MTTARNQMTAPFPFPDMRDDAAHYAEIDAIALESMLPGGEFHPFTPANFDEALQEIAATTLSDKLLREINAHCQFDWEPTEASDELRSAAIGYWTRMSQAIIEGRMSEDQRDAARRDAYDAAFSNN